MDFFEFPIISQNVSKSMIKEFSERIKEMGTNMKFSINPWANNNYSLKENDEINILGYSISIKTRSQIEAKTKRLESLFTNIIWISYRKNFPPLLPSLCNSEFISDTGWGCMIRVGQMMFAQALKKHIFFDRLKPDGTENYVTIPKSELKTVIIGFLDEDHDSPIIAPYSIQKIAKAAFEEFKHKPGEWYNPSNINFILEKLHNNHRIKGTENLEILISNDGMVFLDKMLERIGVEKCECENEKKLEISTNGKNNKSKDKEKDGEKLNEKEEFLLIKDFDDLKKSESEIIRKRSENMNDLRKSESEIIRKKSEDDQSQSSNEVIENHEEEEKKNVLTDSYESLHLNDTIPSTSDAQSCKFCRSSKKSLFYIIMIQIGLETPGLNYLEIVGKMMKSQYSVGMIGGKPSSALYFVGLHHDYFLYLDPHYVQNSTNMDNINNLLDTYFCDNIKTMKTKNISPSLALGFYLRNPEEVKDFYKFLNALSNTHQDSFFLGLEKCSAEYDDFKISINQMKEFSKGKDLSASWEIIE